MKNFDNIVEGEAAWIEFARKNIRKIAVIVVPHPDDLDILVGHTTVYYTTHNYQVIEVLSNWGEYRLVNRLGKAGNHLKGKRLASIRKKENSNAKKEYGNFPDGSPRVITFPLDYIDGYVPSGPRSVARFQRLLKILKPAVVVGPEPVFSYDWHHDHMAAAYMVHFGVKGLSDTPWLKQYLLYQTFRANYRLPKLPETWDVLSKTLNAHHSQLTPFGIKLIVVMQRLVAFFRGKSRNLLRRVDIKQLRQKNAKMARFTSFWERILHSLLAPTRNDASIYLPKPEELGLKRFPNA